MKFGLIDFLYTPEDCERIRSLYKDKSLKPLIQKAIGNKVITSKNLVDTNSLDVLSLICLNQNFTEDTAECFSVAVFLQRGMYNFHPYPSITEDKGISLASKTLVALSFFKPALIKRWKTQGAPTPDFYRRVSQGEFERAGHENIAAHHQQWENFLFEHLV